jgi:hypothetical protein
MSQITQNVALLTKIIGYADDWVIYTRDHNMQNAQANLQLTVNKVASRAGNIGFQISPEKLFACTFATTAIRIAGRLKHPAKQALKNAETYDWYHSLSKP